MGWSDRLLASLDEQAETLETDLGVIQVAREGTGPTVLAIHGGPGGFDQGLAFSGHFLSAGCEVVAPSRPGYLRTPLASGRSPEQQADLLAAMLESLGIDRVAVAGVSSGGPSAVHFAARHPTMTSALLLDACVLMPLEQAFSRLERAMFGSRLGVWCAYQLAVRRPRAVAAVMADSFSTGLSKKQMKEAAAWIRADPERLHVASELTTMVAPRDFRQPGLANDEANEVRLPPLPFDRVQAPTMIAHGANDGLVPLSHSQHAADRIDGAELWLVEEGHHALGLSRHSSEMLERQIELVHATR